MNDILQNLGWLLISIVGFFVFMIAVFWTEDIFMSVWCRLDNWFLARMTPEQLKRHKARRDARNVRRAARYNTPLAQWWRRMNGGR